MNASEVKLGQYADGTQSTYENVTAFMQDVGRASLPDVVGATGGAWAVCHGVMHRLIEEGRVIIDENMKPWDYVWKGN